MRILLLPFSMIYGLLVFTRNSLYRLGVLSSKEYQIPIIGIGNLRVGGTGKTPMTEFVLSLVSGKIKKAVLSRGYGRSTSGYLLASNTSSANDIGDEPRQMMSKFPDTVFAVDEKRVRGVSKLLNALPDLQLIVLDDVFQHRAIKPGLMILLTSYDDLYSDDFILPAGMLREHRYNARYADVIVVTKCPKEISKSEQHTIKKQLNPGPEQKVFFAFEEYGTPVSITDTDLLYDDKSEVVLITGIAKADKYKAWLSKSKSIKSHLQFKDHYWFTEKDLDKAMRIQKEHNSMVVTSEKDAQRIQPLLHNKRFANLPIFYVPIRTQIIGEGANQFNQYIDEFIRSYKTYS